MSKLYPRSVKTSLLGYFGRGGYKLLDKQTGSVFRSRDVIFIEGNTNYATQSVHIDINDTNDPFLTAETQQQLYAISKQGNFETEPEVPQ